MRFLILLVLFPAWAFPVWAQAACNDYLKTDRAGDKIGVMRIETLKGHATKVYDVSDFVRERSLPTDKAINIFRMDDLFDEGKFFIGFGRPNVYVGFPKTLDRPSWEKFDAKSLKRADSKIVDTRGFAQSGVLLVFKDLTPEQVEHIYQTAKTHEGSRNWTCVNSNCKMMADAGFSIPGKDLSKIYFPTQLLKALLENGLEFNGQKVEFDVVRVNHDFLESIGARIDKAVALTMCRHLDRSCQDEKERVASNSLLVFPKKMGKRVLSFFLSSEKEGRAVLEQAPVRFKEDPNSLQNTYDLKVSEPSQFGTFLRVLWGPHAKFKVDISKMNLAERFGDTRLKPYPNSPDKFKARFIQSLKKNVIFNRFVVGLINSQMESRECSFEGVTMKQLYDMLRVHTVGFNNKYTLVITSKELIITKIDIQNSTVDWILTKHLVASNYSDDVIFAGEFYKATDGSIHVDDNSGTYQPSEELLEKVGVLLQDIFPSATIHLDAH